MCFPPGVPIATVLLNKFIDKLVLVIDIWRPDIKSGDRSYSYIQWLLQFGYSLILQASLHGHGIYYNYICTIKSYINYINSKLEKYN